MRILVNRYISNKDATLSRISVVSEDGRIVYRCYGLEDEWRAVKVDGETRVPAGIYRIVVRREGGFHHRYSNDRRFKDIHEGMLWIKDVPGFQWILIHVGNYETDTDGCLLVGRKRDESLMHVYRSVEAYRALYQAVIKEAKAGHLFIEFQDNDRIDYDARC